MGGRIGSKVKLPLRRIDAAAKHGFVVALKAGAGREQAARKAGFSLTTFYRARAKDADFAAAWDAVAAAPVLPRIVAPGNRRRLQSRRIRHLRFTAERQATFLSHFAGTCNAAESAEVAGVCEATVYRHRVKDAAFAAAFQEALEQGYVRLEAEALRQRLEAQRRLGETLGDGALPTGEVATEFERVLKLLERWDRRGGRVGPRTVAPGRRQGWTFDEAIDALAKRLQALDIPIRYLPGAEERA